MSSWRTGTENLVTRKRFGAEGSLLNNSLKVSGSIGIVMETRLAMLVVRGFFIFKFFGDENAQGLQQARVALVLSAKHLLQVLICVLLQKYY